MDDRLEQAKQRLKAALLNLETSFGMKVATIRESQVEEYEAKIAVLENKYEKLAKQNNQLKAKFDKLSQQLEKNSISENFPTPSEPLQVSKKSKGKETGLNFLFEEEEDSGMELSLNELKELIKSDENS